MTIPLTEILMAALMVGVRVSGVMMFAPFLGSVVIPMPVKAILTIAITAVLYPSSSARFVAVSVSQWPLVVGRELLLGVAIGLATNLVFEAIQVAGQILSIQMGYSLVNIMDPTTQVDTTVISVFHNTIAMLIFLQLNVHHWILRAVGHSFEFLPPASITLNGEFVRTIMQDGLMILVLGVQIASPVLIATLAADVALGFLGKASPQMQLMLLGPALKSLLGLAILGTALAYWPSLFERYFGRSIAFTDKILELAR